MKKLSLAILISCIGVAGSAMAQSSGATSSTHGPTVQNAPPLGGGEGGNKEIGGMPRSGARNESNSTGNPGDKADTSGASGSSTYGSSPSSSDTSGASSSGKTSIDSTRGMSSDKGESGTPGDRTKRHNPPTQ